MNNKQEKLKRIIDICSKIIYITDDKKEALLIKYSKMSDNEIIKDLAKNVYYIIGKNSPYYDYLLTIIRDYNSSICPNIEEMKVILDKMFSNQIDGNMSLEDNHKLIISVLTEFCSLFNQYGIDYYIVGALPCFLKVNLPLFRYHDDIDIMVNEEDIPKIREIMELMGYKFFDDRYPSKERFIEIEKEKPPHIILAQNPYNEFHLGFFCFRREQDNSITMREYSHRLENGEVVVDVLERLSTPIGTSLRYDDKPIIYNGVKFKTSSIESVYSLKRYTKRPKDITDIKKLEPYIDKRKLELLDKYPNKNIIIENVNLNNIHINKK